MKKIILTGIMATLFLITGCKKKETENNVSQTKTDSAKVETVTTSQTFDVNTIPESDKEMGEFPYFTVPEWLDASSTYGGDRKSDFGKLEVYTGYGFYPVEGKIFSKSYTMRDAEGNNAWDEYRFVQSFSKHFESLGAKKIWEGEIPDEAKEELDKQHNRDDYFYHYGTPHQENTVVYALRKNGKPVFFLITSNSSYGGLHVAENTDFVQTIGIIKSDKIQQDLAEKGKSVLHINFDTDKSTLKPDGKEAVAEIAKVLKNDSNLKLDINGYTDNSGDAAHNLQLSKGRANSVIAELASLGIDKSRLSGNGFGAENPIASNDSEDGKAQNRRVELVKR